jgi:enamine deaminase RidA (YjgF/YER057c/UK114 family)
VNRVRVSGPRSGYNDAASAAGVIALAGQIADASVIAAGTGFAAEFDSALGNLVRALEAAGGEPSGLLHLRIFVTDLEAYTAARPEIAGCYRRRLGGHYPATTLVGVAGLLDGASVEIEGLAAT